MMVRELADPPLRYLLQRVKDTVIQDNLPAGYLLPHPIGPPEQPIPNARYYVPREEDEKVPWTWRIPLLDRLWTGPLTIDAYDGAADMTIWSFILRHVPLGGDLVQVMVRKQLLDDRHIPLYRAHQAPQQQPPPDLAVFAPPPGMQLGQLQPKLKQLQRQQAAQGSSVRYFYSPGQQGPNQLGDGSNLRVDSANPKYAFHSRSFEAFRR